MFFKAVIPIRSPSMSETFRCQIGKNMCKPCQSWDTQLTADTQKRSITESQTWFASFIICSTREDATFCPRLSHMPPDRRRRGKEKNLGCHYGLRSKGCFGGQCFGSSTCDLKPHLFCLSKLKYRDTKASQIKSHWTFIQHSHSNFPLQHQGDAGGEAVHSQLTAGLSVKPHQLSHNFV